MPVTDDQSTTHVKDTVNEQYPSATREGLTLLREILSFGNDWAQTQHVRQNLFQPGGWDLVFAAASDLRVMPALIDKIEQRNLIPPFPITVLGGASHPKEIVKIQKGFHEQLRTDLRNALLEAVDALNQIDVEPTLLKGARYLWTGTNPTRTMRDLDFLVDSKDAEKSNIALLRLGYAATGADSERTSRHHLPSLFHPNRSGWIELHRRAGNSYSEAVFSTKQLLNTEQAFEQNGLRVRLPSAAAHIWQALVHHYFGHSGFARGEIHLKPLYEFALALMQADKVTFDEIEGYAASSNVARASFSLWVAAARHGLGVEFPFLGPMHDDIVQLSIRNLERAQLKSSKHGKYPGYRELLKLAWGKEVRAHTRSGAVRVASGRLKDLGILAPKVSLRVRFH
jgi:hypothetical protein